MRILRLDLSHGRGTVDLHPFISIVQGLDEVQAEDMVAAIRGLVRGSGAGIGGLVESGGELVELRGDGRDQIGPLTIEDVFVSLVESEVDQDPVVLRSLLDQQERRAMIDAVHLEEVRADLNTGAAARVQRLHQAISAFDGADGGQHERLAPIHKALADVLAQPAVLRETPDDISEILLEWEEYETARASAQPQLDSINRRVEGLLTEREECQRSAAEAQALAVPVVLTSVEDLRVEELANPASAGKKSRRGGGAEAAELEQLLAKVGQTSYLGYAMYRLAPLATPESLTAVEEARVRLEQIEARLEAARDEMQHGDVATALNELLESVKQTARRHLGPMLPSDLGSALREQVVERDNPDWIEALRVLYEELVAHDVVVPDDLAPHDLPTWTVDWLQRAETPDGSGPSRPQLLGELATAEKELDRHIRAMSRIDRLELVAMESDGQADETRAQLLAADGAPESSAERAVAMLRPLADRVRAEAGCSVPLVVQGNFRDLAGAELCEMLDELEVLSQDLQLVLMCDRPEAVAWASDVGLRRALGSRVAPTTV